jgi:phosphatidylglycerophosphate synthase
MTDVEFKAGERRPIASRDLALSQQVAAFLADRGASPNAISVGGMIAAIVGGLAFWATSFPMPATRLFWLTAAAMAQLRLLANMFDGMVAIRRQIASPVGELYNEVPDRISDSALFIGLGFAAGGQPLLGFAAALAAVFTAYVRAMAKVAGAPQDFCGPFAKPERMFAITVLALYCTLAPASWQPIWDFRGQPLGLAAATLSLITVGSLWTSVRRLLRAAAFLRAHPR